MIQEKIGCRCIDQRHLNFLEISHFIWYNILNIPRVRNCYGFICIIAHLYALFSGNFKAKVWVVPTYYERKEVLEDIFYSSEQPRWTVSKLSHYAKTQFQLLLTNLPIGQCCPWLYILNPVMYLYFPSFACTFLVHHITFWLLRYFEWTSTDILASSLIWTKLYGSKSVKSIIWRVNILNKLYLKCLLPVPLHALIHELNFEAAIWRYLWISTIHVFLVL